jgi:hypothetical protein
MLKKRPSSGYDKPRQPDASDLRVAASVVIKSRFVKEGLSKDRAAMFRAFNRRLKNYMAWRFRA